MVVPQIAVNKICARDFAPLIDVELKK